MPTDADVWPSGEGEMARRVRAFDWAATPLGASATWPQSLRTAVDMVLAMPGPATILWGPTHVQLYNDAYVAIAQGRHPALLGLPVSAGWPEVYEAVVAPLLEAARAGRATRETGFAVTLRSPDGSSAERIFDTDWSPIWDESGAVAGALQTLVEVTDRHRADVALRQSEEGFRALATAGAFSTYRMSPDWRQMRQLVGGAFLADTAEATEDWADGYLLDEDRPAIFAAIDEAIRTRSLFELEHRVRRTDGSVGWVSSRAVPITGADGRIVEWFGAATDVTERRDAADRLLSVRNEQEFILRFSDALRPVRDPVEIQSVATRMLGEQLEASRVFYVVVADDGDTANIYSDYADGVPSRVGRYSLSSFSTYAVGEWRAGRTAASSDVDIDRRYDASERAAYASVSTRAGFGVPLIKDGRLVALLGVNQSSPRHWTERDIALASDVAERTWAAVERALAEAALRESEERQAFLLKLGDALRSLADPADIQVAAMRVLAERMAVMRAAYLDVHADGDTMTMAARYEIDAAPTPAQLRLSDYGPGIADAFRAGQTQFVRDTFTESETSSQRAAYRAIGVGAWIVAPIVKHGRLIAVVGVQCATSRDWTKADVLLIDEVAERTWAAVERARAEAALRENEEKYRTLFENMGQGYALGEVIRDEEGRAVDLRYLELNPAFERLSGIPVAQALGRTVREVYGTVEPEWFEVAERVARLKVPERVEYEIGAIGRWFQMDFYPAEGNRYLGLYEDVTDRKRAELALRDSEERQAFLLKLSDTLRPLSDPVEMQTAAMRLLAEHLDVMRAGYLNVDPDGDTMWMAARFERNAPSTPDRVRLSDYGPALVAAFRAGHTRWVRDASAEAETEEQRAAYRAIDVQSWIIAPLVKDGRLIAIVGVVEQTPRDWTSVEVELVTELAERTWATVERARVERALRESEERLRQFGEASQDVLWIRDAEALQWQYLTPAFEAIYGLSRDEALDGNNFRIWVDLIVPEDRERAINAIRRVRDGDRVTFDYRVRRPKDGAIRWLRNTDFPIKDAAGKVTLIGGVGHDLTELRDAEVRLQALIEGIPQLVWRAVDGGHWTWASPQWTAFTGQSEPDSHNLGWLATLHPDDREAALEAWAHAIERGSLEVEYRLCHHEAHAYRWFQTRATPVRDDAGAIVEWLGTSTDIQELRALQGRQQVMVQELQHRTRNLITVVGALSGQTMKNAVSLADFDERFGQRLAALSRVQGLLSHLSAGKRISFDELLRSELSGLGAPDDRVTLDGPSGVPLRSGTVQTFSLAVHELATNALKYGALGASDGHLTVRWSVIGDPGRPRLLVDWRESGVVLTQVGDRPRGGGYGRQLIERALPYQLDADTSYEMTADGVHCTIEVPISTAQAGAGHHLEHSAA